MSSEPPNTAPKQTNNYLETLLSLGRLLNSSLDLHHVLETAIEQVISFVGAERGFILLVDMRHGKIWGEALRNIEKEGLEATLKGKNRENRAEISKTIVEDVLKHHKPVLSHNAMEDPRFADRASVQLTHLRSVLCVPLVAQGKSLGIIYVDNRIRNAMFTEHHLSMLSAFANQASVAIENARLYENLRRSLDEKLSLQDALHKQETTRLALEEAGRLKSDFIGFVAHELRNPLTTIRGYVQTLQQDTEHTLDPETIEEFYGAIEADADRLLELINDLLDVSRLEAGRPLTISRREVDVRGLLERLVKRHRFYKYYTQRHNLELRLADNIPPTISADEDKLNQIISNLLSNAIKYSPDGGKIEVYAGLHDGNTLHIQVRDSGVGMTEEQVGRLFRQYERIERSSIQNIPGTGLGLYLTKNLVELHGGTIVCESAPGEGSAFAVSIPVR